MRATMMPLARSATMLMRLKPKRSTMLPPMKAARAMGRAVKNPVMPVFSALPVVWRTNHGMASAVRTLPTIEMPFAV